MNRVIITGISRGLGKELFNLFASRNYFVYGISRNKSENKKLENKYPKNSKVIYADLSSDKSIGLIQKYLKDTPINLLINNAGIAGNAHLIENIESTEIIELFNIHCLGVFRTVKALRGNLLKTEKPIVLNLNSRLGSISRQSNGTYQNLMISYSYRIAKASQNMLTNCLRSEFKGKIQFISIHPGKMKTEIGQKDADIEPILAAKMILSFYENGKLKEENGIIELEKDIIDW